VKTAPVGYVGRKRCAECHAKQAKGWEGDWHARALSPANSKYVVGDFKNAHFKGSSSEAWTSREKGGYRMRTAGLGGALATFPISWVVGGKRMQDTITEFPDGRWQMLPVYFHVTGKGEWVDYTEAKQGALAPDHPFYWTNFRRTANRECLDCHVTGLDVSYDRAAHKWTTTMVDGGVACESCHGPGLRHADTQAPEDIVQPGKAPPEIGLGLCAQCHGPRNPLFPVLDASHHFQPGQQYGDSYQPYGLFNGHDRSGDFFSDGRPKTSSFEVQALLQSRCHLQGKATCLTCHTSPHGSHDPNEMKRPLAGAGAGAAPHARSDAVACQGCHQPLFTARQEHSHHKEAAAQSCVACHMPPVVTGVLDKFADHSIDVPVPENSEKHGIPNACNVCHTKETPAEMSKALKAWWPGAAERAKRRLRLADAFDDATKARSRDPLQAVIADADEAPLLRSVAALLLAQRFPDVAGGAITPLLTSTDPLLRAKAAEALALAKVKRAAAALAQLEDDPSIFVREAGALALAELADPRAEAALRALTQAASTTGLPRPHALLGFSLARRGEVPAAIQELERAVDLQPYNVEALVLLADLYARRDEFELTRARLEEALLFDPQHPGVKKRLAMLAGEP
jgi:Flp pilus assembly protein TadD